MGEAYRISDQNAIHFLTFTVIDWMDVFTRKEHKLVVVESLNHCVAQKGLVVHGWVLMSNHLHLLARAREGARLSDVVRDVKKFTSRKVREIVQTPVESRQHWLLDRMAFRARQSNRADEFKLWESVNHAEWVQSTWFMEQKLNYIHQNPVRQMVVTRAEDYLFSSAMDYAGETGLVTVELVR